MLRFDLSGTSYENSDDFTAKISEYLARFEKKYGVEPEKQIGGRFYNVIEAAYRATGRKVVILIDEYDKPMPPLFYQAGYLTIKDYDPDTEKYILGLPNREVSKAFWDTLGKHYFRGGINRSQFDLDKFV